MTTLTATERATLSSMRDQARNGSIGYWQIYQWLADLLENTYQVPSTDSAVLWLRGATEANAGRGAFSELIRTYSEAQGLLRSLLFSLPNSDQTARLTSTGVSSASIDIANDWCDASRRLAP